ncbi:MAG: NUDIX domain-containing protein [Nanoarchaeota archaeon]|nr:NUDIX domain-containing protein [Nanoarchaeota archaeon]
MEKKILELFLYNNKLKFNEIEKQTKIRSNKLSYHLKKLIKEKILELQGEFYKLSETSEILIPYLSSKKHVLSVILIHLGDAKNVFLHSRKKRPYKNKLSLPGGRILLGENLNDSVKRIMKEKHNINAKLKTIHSVSIEHLRKKRKIIHSYLLVFVTAQTKDKINLTNIDKNKSKIISSDYSLIKKDLNKKIDIKNIFSRV